MRKRAQNLKSITILLFITSFHNFILKIDTSCATRVKIILKTGNVNDDY